jgi:hypothetical protein
MKKGAFFLCVLLTVAIQSYSQNYKLRTVIIYSFTRYVLWPEETGGGNFEIKVLGDSPFIDELRSMAETKKVGNRSIAVQKVTSAEDAAHCHILVVPAGASEKLEEVLAQLQGRPVLVVTEEPGMGQQGSDINFIDRDGKLAFELNQNTISKRKLKVSTELTRLAILI